MSSESTAIHDFLAGLQRKELPEDPADDLLFAGSRREGAPRMARGTQPPPRMFDQIAPPAPPVVAAPTGAPMVGPHGYPAAPAAALSQASPFAAPPRQQVVVPLPRAFQQHPGVSGTHVTKKLAGSKRMAAVVAGLFAAVVVLLTVYVTSDDSKPAAAASVAAASDKSVEQPVLAPADEAAKAVVTPIVEPAADKPTVTPIEAAPAPAAEAAVAPAASSEPTVAAAPAQSPDLVTAPAVVHESTFVAKAEQTVPTVGAADEAADESSPAPVAAPKAKKSKRETAREKRAAKRAAKRAKREPVAKKSVARAESAAPAKDAKLDGKGALQVSSASPREVWVDGRNSKRMTPLRVLLKPGKHKVTLFDKSSGSAKTFEVEIKANETTKVSK